MNEKSENQQSKILVTLTGPSLSGKSTLERLLADNGCEALVSTTTRHPRAGEENGKHYHFISKADFESQLKSGAFIEHVHFDGNFYGVGRKEAEEAFKKGKPAVVVCEPNGARQMHAYAKKEGWTCVRVFVNNSKDLLIERFLDRFKNDEKATPARYASRLRQMMEKEQSEWVEPALSGGTPYEMVVPSFTNENQDQVMGEVMDRIKSLQNGAEAKPKKSTPSCR